LECTTKPVGGVPVPHTPSCLLPQLLTTSDASACDRSRWLSVTVSRLALNIPRYIAFIVDLEEQLESIVEHILQ